MADKAHHLRVRAVQALNYGHRTSNARLATLFGSLASSFDRLADQADRHKARWREFCEVPFAPRSPLHGGVARPGSFPS